MKSLEAFDDNLKCATYWSRVPAWVRNPVFVVPLALALFFAAMWCGLPYPGRYAIVTNPNVSYRIDRMTGRTWMVTPDGLYKIKETQ